MATSKSSNASSSTTSIGSNLRQKDDLATLKAKVVELERQIIEYKTKLDELRRAKATTVVKLEKEYINTAQPGSNRAERTKNCDKCEELERLIDSERKSNGQLKKLVEQKESSSSKTSTLCQSCSTYKQLIEQEKQTNQLLSEQVDNERRRTKQEIESRQIIEQTLDSTNADLNEMRNIAEALRIENKQYQNAFDRMKQEHELKMAELFQREEEAKKQVATWEQMYREWMATMERRVNNLQVTNEELQTWLHEDNQIGTNRRADNSNNGRNQRH